MLNTPKLRLWHKLGAFNHEHRNICDLNEYSRLEALRNDSKGFMTRWLLIIWTISILIACILMEGCADASIVKVNGYSDSDICNAIYIAEGGNKTSHLYGILVKYKHTTPRQACINTVKHKRVQWTASITHGDRRDFITYLGSKYCPLGASNDPQGLNINWIKNVKYYLAKGTK